jgi:hypothetical protein
MQFLHRSMQFLHGDEILANLPPREYNGFSPIVVEHRTRVDCAIDRSRSKIDLMYASNFRDRSSCMDKAPSLYSALDLNPGLIAKVHLSGLKLTINCVKIMEKYVA